MEPQNWTQHFRCVSKYWKERRNNLRDLLPVLFLVQRRLPDSHANDPQRQSHVRLCVSPSSTVIIRLGVFLITVFISHSFLKEFLCSLTSLLEHLTESESFT